MARKLRKPHTPLPRLFIYLLIPWLVMGAVSVALVTMGWGSLTIFVGALGAALITTYLIRIYEKRRLREQALSKK